jgi:predicted Zn-dependent peptidase
VLEEILEDVDDEGRQIDPDNISRSLIYPHHPLGFTITGGQTEVRSFDEGMLRRHHQRHYTSENMVLVFSGGLDAEAAERIAERDFSHLPRGKRIEATAPQHDQKGPRLEIVENASSQTELRVCLRAAADRDPRRPALDILLRVIDDGMSTRLYHRLCDARGLCYDVSAGFDSYEDDGIVDVAAGVQHKRAALVTREILGMLEDLAREGPTAEELGKARRRIAWDARSMADSAEETSAFFASGNLFGRPSTPEQHVAELSAVDAEAVREAARFIARPERLSVVAVGLLDDGEQARLEDTVHSWKGAP